MKLGLCQMPVTASKTENDTVMRRYVRDAAAAGCDLIVLPEMWCCPYNNAAFVQYAEPQGGETWRLLRDTARACGVWIVAGSVPERDGDAIYNTCYVFDPQGRSRRSTARCTCSISTWRAASAFSSPIRSRPGSNTRSWTRRSENSAWQSASTCALLSSFAFWRSRARG